MTGLLQITTNNDSQLRIKTTSSNIFSVFFCQKEGNSTAIYGIGSTQAPNYAASNMFIKTDNAIHFLQVL